MTADPPPLEESAPTRRRRTPLVVVVGLVVALAIAGVLWRSDSGSSSRPTWRPLPTDHYLEPRVEAATASTRRYQFAYGGDSATTAQRYSDGVLTKPAKNEYRTVSGPFEGPLVSPVAARIGNQFLVVGVECSSPGHEADSDTVTCADQSVAAALYNPAKDAWKAMAIPKDLATGANSGWRPPNTAPVLALVGSTPDRAVVSVASPAGVQPARAFWQFDKATRAWSPVASSGSPQPASQQQP